MRWMALVLAFIPAVLFSQTRKQRKIIAAQEKADEQVVSSFKDLFFHLGSDKNSTPQAASAYIANQFQAAGLKPLNANNYLQTSRLDKGKQIDPSTFLKINGARLAIAKEYFPLSYSASKTVNGMPVMALRERGVPWFMDVKDWCRITIKTGETFMQWCKKKP